MSFEKGWFLPGVDHELVNLGPWELEQEMRRIAGWFRQLPHGETHPGVFPAFGVAAAAIGPCEGCGRTLISAVHHEATRRLGYCGRCRPLSSTGRVDHGEWVRARRGAR